MTTTFLNIFFRKQILKGFKNQSKFTKDLLIRLYTVSKKSGNTQMKM
jgi:hypothetical protein